MLKDDEIEKKVMLLKMLLREDDESMDDILKALANTGMFTLDEAKKHLQELRDRGFVVGDNLSFMGVSEARKAKQEFTLEN
jgi:predicted ArsR family transcriptional regulator